MYHGCSDRSHTRSSQSKLITIICVYTGRINYVFFFLSLLCVSHQENLLFSQSSPGGTCTPQCALALATAAGGNVGNKNLFVRGREGAPPFMHAVVPLLQIITFCKLQLRDDC